MKIGLSFGKCLRDIVTGKVRFDDVAVIICSTKMEDEEGLKQVVEHYMDYPQRLKGLDREKCQEVAHSLYIRGKLHQPRMFGAYRLEIEDKFTWMDIVPSSLEDIPSVQEAWDQYRMMLTLTAEKLPSLEEVGSQIVHGSCSY